MKAPMKRIVCSLAIVLSICSFAQAASSDWFETEGARLRLVTEDAASADGLMKGVLEIDLQPGWKTYWKDPGASGIAPQIDVSASMNVEGAAFSFPAPKRFREGEEVSTGYVEPVALPVTFEVGDPEKFTAIDADILLGICKEICVPVQARLSVTPGGEIGTVDPVILESYGRLPSPASAEFGLAGLRDDGESLVADAALPADAQGAELFVVAPRGWLLGVPELDASSGRPAFRIPVAGRPTPGGTATFDYTLVAGGKAVEGQSSLP